MGTKRAPLPAGITRVKGLKKSPAKLRYYVRIMYHGKQYSAGIYETLSDAKAALKKYKQQAFNDEFEPSGVRYRRRREERAAEKALQDQARLEAEQDQLTVSVYVDQWIRELEFGAEPRTPGTITSYTSTLNAHIIPALGDTPLAKVDQGAVDKLLSQVSIKSGPSASRNVARTLRAMYNYAVNEGAAGMTQPPFKVSVAKPKHRADSEIPTPAEVTLISQNMPEETRLAPLLAAVCALRPAEVLGLQRRDFKGLDTGKPTLTVSRQWAQKTKPPSYQPPKYDSVRTVAIPAFLVPQIKEHLAVFVSAGLQSPVFVSPVDPQKPISGTSYLKVWNQAIEAAGTPSYVQHSLRHLGLTLLAVVGATSAEIMARGGHTDPEAAARYQHALRGRDYQLVDALGKEWEGTR